MVSEWITPTVELLLDIIARYMHVFHEVILKNKGDNVFEGLSIVPGIE